jgi:hypothetical protein
VRLVVAHSAVNKLGSPPVLLAAPRSTSTHGVARWPPVRREHRRPGGPAPVRAGTHANPRPLRGRDRQASRPPAARPLKSGQGLRRRARSQPPGRAQRARLDRQRRRRRSCQRDHRTRLVHRDRGPPRRQSRPVHPGRTRRCRRDLRYSRPRPPPHRPPYRASRLQPGARRDRHRTLLTWADVLATAAFVLGPAALQRVSALDGYATLLLLPDGHLHGSAGTDDLLSPARAEPDLTCLLHAPRVRWMRPQKCSSTPPNIRWGTSHKPDSTTAARPARAGSDDYTARARPLLLARCAATPVREYSWQDRTAGAAVRGLAGADRGLSGQDRAQRLAP